MTPIRAAALDLLSGVKGAFLRCDRGSSLYVTNVPMRTEAEIGWDKAGFHHRTEGKLCFLIPDDLWIERLEGWLERHVKEKRLAGRAANACFGEVCEADFALWIEGIKRLELHADAAGYEKLVRQRAAVCLREKRGGGTIISCALMADYLNEGGIACED